MYRVLRIIFCILACIICAGAIFVFVYAPSLWWGILAIGVAAIFAGLMFLFKRLEEKKKFKENPPPPQGDFITGRVENNDGDKQ